MSNNIIILETNGKCYNMLQIIASLLKKTKSPEFSGLYIVFLYHPNFLHSCQKRLEIPIGHDRLTQASTDEVSVAVGTAGY